MSEKIFFSPDEVKLACALQLLAVLIGRQGGEVLIDRKEFESFEDCPVVGRDYGTHVVIRVGEEEEGQLEFEFQPDSFNA